MRSWTSVPPMTSHSPSVTGCAPAPLQVGELFTHGVTQCGVVHNILDYLQTSDICWSWTAVCYPRFSLLPVAYCSVC
jgi:hypothetical protein